MGGGILYNSTMLNANAAKTPLFKDMSDDQLREAYWATRALTANADGIATLHANMGLRARANKSVGQIFRQLKNLDIIVAISRKRGISLARPAV